MKRLIEEKLIAWKNNPSKKPLMLDGARQIGKTYSMLEFGKSHYSNVAYFNFDGQENLKSIFESDLDPKRILFALESYLGITISKETTLIIFDEIQECKRAISSLKYFYEIMPEYHIIAAGSLLGVSLNKMKMIKGKEERPFSFPVGKVDHLQMYPLNFEEFLWAAGYEKLSFTIRECYVNFLPMNSALHEKALELYKTYLVVGGMPAVVKAYTEKKDFDYARIEQNQIYSDYTKDMSKYAQGIESVRHEAVYNSLPSQLIKENQKFQYAVIKSGARAKDYEDSVLWLKKAGIALLSYLVPAENQISLPLEAYKDNFSFKVFLSDVGLLCSKLAINPAMVLSGINFGREAKGALTENYLATELQANGHSLFYWESKSKAEVDFLLQINGEFIPIECKAADNTNSKSLKVFVQKFKPAYSFRISAKNFGFENNIKSVPLYATFCIKP